MPWSFKTRFQNFDKVDRECRIVELIEK